MSKLVYMLLHPDANFAKLKTREDPYVSRLVHHSSYTYLQHISKSLSQFGDGQLPSACVNGRLKLYS
jgi:hypothetical protein